MSSCQIPAVLNPSRRRFAHLLAVASLLMISAALPAPLHGQAAGGAIDMDRARELLQKQRSGQQLTPDEQQYLNRTREEFQKTHGQVPPQGQLPPARPGETQKGSAPVPEGVKALHDLDYGGSHTKNQTLDLYIPAGTKPLPLIVWIHGGGWTYQDKNPCEAMQFLSRGYVVASINYRLSDQAIWPAQIHDCKGALRYLRAHAQEYHIDANEVGVWGSSAGGHLVAMLAVSGGVKELEGTVGGNLQSSSRVQAACDWFGPSDLGKFTDPRAVDLVVKLVGAPVAQAQAQIRSASPVTYVSKDVPPILIMHGDADVMVPVDQSRMLYDALKKAGAPDFTLSLTPHRGHGFEAMAIPANLATVADFFDKHLKPAPSPTARSN